MKYTIAIDDSIRDAVSKMTWKELLDHCCCPNFFHGQTPEKEYGAIFVHSDKKTDMKKQIENYASSSRFPTLVTADFEHGPGCIVEGATNFPSMLGCARSGDPELNYQMGRASAMQGREIGINWAFGPVADVLGNDQNPITGIRSSGRTVEDVVKYAGAYMRGMQDYGMAATLKHFPGDGFDIYDQHLTTSVNPLSKDEWRKISGAAFRQLIEEGAMSVMAGHIALPSFDPSGLPATLSKILLTDLLKGELGFDGIIISDAYEMGGMLNVMNPFDAAATFFEAGGDCLLFSWRTQRFYDELKARIDNGMLKLDTLRQRAARLIAFGRDLAAKAAQVPLNVDMTRDAQLSRELARRAVTVARDRNNVLPFTKKNPKILHITLASTPDYDGTSLFASMDAMLATHGQLKTVSDPGPRWISDNIEEYDLAVVSMAADLTWAVGVKSLHGPVARNFMRGWMHLGIPVVFISHFDDTVHKQFNWAMDTVINTYGSTDDSIPKLAEVIFGTQIS